MLAKTRPLSQCNKMVATVTIFTKLRLNSHVMQRYELSFVTCYQGELPGELQNTLNRASGVEHVVIKLRGNVATLFLISKTSLYTVYTVNIKVRF